MTLKKLETIIPAGGDVFRDLGIELSPTERAKIDIAAEITLTINRLNLTQAEAAALMETDQAKVSAIMRGRLTGFTLDRLISFLLALGKDIEMNITPIGRVRRLGRLVIHTNKKASGMTIATHRANKSRKTAAIA